MPPVITERDLAAACQETLRLWPQARAAVLFGSRARGTAHPDSDWDVQWHFVSRRFLPQILSWLPTG